MRKYRSILSLLILVSLITACRKHYDCECTTLHTDNSGPGSNETSRNIHPTPGRMTRLRAESWCHDYERNRDLGNGQQVSTTCTLGDRY